MSNNFLATNLGVLVALKPASLRARDFVTGLWGCNWTTDIRDQSHLHMSGAIDPNQVSPVACGVTYQLGEL